ncbi:MAG: lipopolysaccharide kinase InaA family protein [Sulfolobales archaeon]
MDLIIRILSSPTAGLKSNVTSDNLVEVHISRAILELDCLYNIFSFSICAPYVFYSRKEDLDPSLVERSIRMNIIPSLVDDLYNLIRVIDLLKINYKYVLYKRFHELARIFKDVKIYQAIAYRYLYSKDDRSSEIDSIVKKILDLDNEIYIDSNIIRNLIRNRGGLLGEGVVRFRSEIGRISEGLSIIKALLDQSINPYLKIFRRIDLDLDQDITTRLPPPERLITLPEGVIVRGLKATGRIIKRNSEKISASKNFLEKLSSARVREVEGLKVVEKRFLDVSSVKWFFTSPVLEILKRYGISMTTDPLNRLWNDYIYSIRLRKLGLNTPRILYVDPWGYKMIREYVDARDVLTSIIKESDQNIIESICRDLGRVLALIHRNGICLSDSNPRNFLVERSSNKIYVIDLEQTSECSNINNMSWDLSMMIYFSYLISSQKHHIKISPCVRNLIEGYARSYEDRERLESVLRNLDNPLYLTIFITASSLIFSPISTAAIYKAYSALKEVKNII